MQSPQVTQPSLVERAEIKKSYRVWLIECVRSCSEIWEVADQIFHSATSLYCYELDKLSITFLRASRCFYTTKKLL